MTIDGEIPFILDVEFVPGEDILNATKQAELTNDVELELVNRQINEMKTHLGKPGLLSNHVWRHLKRTIEKSDPNLKTLASKVLRNMEWRKRFAIHKARQEADGEKRALMLIQTAMRIINVFDYVRPTTILKSDFYDVAREEYYIRLAQRKIDFQNILDAPHRNAIRSELGFGFDPQQYGFISPAHSSQSDTESVRVIRNLDRAENGSLYFDDESSNGSFFSINDSSSVNEDN